MLKIKDERTKFVNQVLLGIKMIKMYAWELAFENHILKLRDKEIKKLKTILFIQTLSNVLSTVTPILVCFITKSFITKFNKAYLH